MYFVAYSVDLYTQRAHIPKAIMAVLERDPAEDQKVAEKARQEQEEKERIYQVMLHILWGCSLGLSLSSMLIMLND